MPGPAPKPAHLRQRTNKKSTHAVLEAPKEPILRKLPSLPGRLWEKQTRDWWKRVWCSPMASEYLETDVDGLVRLAVLIDDFWKAENPTSRTSLQQEIRLQELRFGLSPIDRSRLHWEIAKGEDAEQKRQKRRREPERPERAADPRSVLKAVS